MIYAMPVDLRLFYRVAWPVAWPAATVAIWVCGCGPTFKPDSPPDRPPGITATKGPAPLTRGRKVVVGEMCPDGAAGRPAIAPLLMRGIRWTDEAAEVSAAVERGSVPRFAVFGSDGGVAGMFDTLGVVDTGLRQQVASGTYAGSPPCTYAGSAKPASGAVATRTAEPKCEAATRGCGIAVGELAHPGDPIPAPAYATGGACVSADQLVVDIDGDGNVESFPIAGVLDGIRSPAAEWTGVATTAPACRPTFQMYDIQLPRAADPGKAVDRKTAVALDVLGVIDLDGDGRRELVLALKFPTVRTIVVYTSTGTPQRLELAGEATSFSP